MCIALVLMLDEVTVKSMDTFFGTGQDPRLPTGLQAALNGGIELEIFAEDPFEQEAFYFSEDSCQAASTEGRLAGARSVLPQNRTGAIHGYRLDHVYQTDGVGERKEQVGEEVMLLVSTLGLDTKPLHQPSFQSMEGAVHGVMAGEWQVGEECRMVIIQVMLGALFTGSLAESFGMDRRYVISFDGILDRDLPICLVSIGSLVVATPVFAEALGDQGVDRSEKFDEIWSVWVQAEENQRAANSQTVGGKLPGFPCGGRHVFGLRDLPRTTIFPILPAMILAFHGWRVSANAAAQQAVSMGADIRKGSECWPEVADLYFLAEQAKCDEITGLSQLLPSRHQVPGRAQDPLAFRLKTRPVGVGPRRQEVR